MKHASIFTRLAQRADPNIPILEAAMEEIARLEEKLETSGYSPITEEVEDILRSKNQNLFNALMESTKRADGQAAEIAKRDERIAELEADQDKANAAVAIGNYLGKTYNYAWCNTSLASQTIDLLKEQSAEISRLKALVGKCKDGIEGALSDDLPYINKCKEALAAIKEIDDAPV